MALVILALARPQHGNEEFRIHTEGITMQMALDRSGSMRGIDFVVEGERVTRLDMVKQVFKEFVAGADELPGRPNDLIGLIGFGGFAESRCPLTLDHGVLLEVLKTVNIPEPDYDRQGNIMNLGFLREESATAIGDSVALGVERLKASTAKSRIIILLTDGSNNAGVVTPEQAADAAKTFGIKIYTIGVGTVGNIPIYGEDEFGKKQIIWITPRRPEYQSFQLDEETLEMLAEKTGGKYFNAQTTEALRDVYAEIDRLEKTKTEGRLYMEYKELFQFALYPGLVLILLELLLTATRFRSLP